MSTPLDILYSDNHLVVVAKYVGFGICARDALTRWNTFAARAPRPIGIARGYLLYAWYPGRPLGFADPGITEADLETLVQQIVVCARLDTVGTIPLAQIAAAAARGLVRLARRFPDVAVTDLASLDVIRGAGRLVRLPRNQGHWHHLRVADQQLARTHLDVSDWPRVSELAPCRYSGSEFTFATTSSLMTTISAL